MSDEQIVEMLRQRIERAERGLRFAWCAVGALGVVCVVLAVMRPGGSGAEMVGLTEIADGEYQLDGSIWAEGFVLIGEHGGRTAALTNGDWTFSTEGPGLRLFDPTDPAVRRAAMWVEADGEDRAGRVRLQMLDAEGTSTIEMMGMGGSAIGHIWKRTVLGGNELQSVD